MRSALIAQNSVLSQNTFELLRATVGATVTSQRWQPALPVSCSKSSSLWAFGFPDIAFADKHDPKSGKNIPVTQRILFRPKWLEQLPKIRGSRDQSSRFRLRFIYRRTTASKAEKHTSGARQIFQRIESLTDMRTTYRNRD